MKVLIIGGAGFIGSYLCHKLVSLGYETITYDIYNQYIPDVSDTHYNNLKFRKLLRKGVTEIRGDVCDFNSLLFTIKEHNPEIIVHLANLPLVNVGVRRPDEAFRGIMQSTFSILEAIRATEPIKLIYSSSSMVYGNFERDPQPEDGEKKPVEIYGSLKLASEIICSAYLQRYDIPLTIIRPSAVYGMGDCNNRVVQTFMESAIFGRKIRVKNGSSTFLDFTYAEDAAEGFLCAIMKPQIDGVFNITRGEGRSLKELVEIIRVFYPEVEIEEFEENDYRPLRGALDISKAREQLGYDPQYSLEEGIERYSWFANRWWK
jgi:UDP-glucose 4-epimerase